jgi:hypothetical protein
MNRIPRNRIASKQQFLHLAIKLLLLGSCIGLVIFGTFYVWSTSASTAQPEPITELYFEDHLHLPSKVLPEKHYVFGFTLHNLENKDMEYPYEVYADLGQGKFIVFDKGTILVKKNEYKTIQEGFAIASAFPKSEIVVNLINKKQHIDFWIEGDSHGNN